MKIIERIPAVDISCEEWPTEEEMERVSEVVERANDFMRQYLTDNLAELIPGKTLTIKQREN